MTLEGIATDYKGGSAPLSTTKKANKQKLLVEKAPPVVWRNMATSNGMLWESTPSYFFLCPRFVQA